MSETKFEPAEATLDDIRPSLKATICGEFPAGAVSWNGRLFTPEAVKNALSHIDNLPIVRLSGETERVIGTVDGNAYDVEETETGVSYKLDGLLFMTEPIFKGNADICLLLRIIDEKESEAEVQAFSITGIGVRKREP